MFLVFRTYKLIIRSIHTTVTKFLVEFALPTNWNCNIINIFKTWAVQQLQLHLLVKSRAVVRVLCTRFSLCHTLGPKTIDKFYMQLCDYQKSWTKYPKGDLNNLFLKHILMLLNYQIIKTNHLVFKTFPPKTGTKFKMLPLYEI